MKVVLFCGGLGTRLRGPGDELPKPMVRIGYRPILWHVMKYYAHYGHTEFILCLGYRADTIKEYFLNYKEHLSNNFTLSDGGKTIDLEQSDIDDWKITFVDTGLRANIGERLRAVRKYVEHDDMFLANYADGLTDLHLPSMVDAFTKSGHVGCLLCTRPSQTFHVVKCDGDGKIDEIHYVRDSDVIINGGYYVFRKQIFEYLRPGEELVNEPFQRLIAEGRLMGYRYDRFWCMDTFKEQQELTDRADAGDAPWLVWRNGV